jgi:putative PIN family toxin of toxin-antitoxin system
VRLVLDTNVIVAAMRSPTGASARLLRLARANRVELLGTLATALEYMSVCSRSEHTVVAGLSDVEGLMFGKAVAALMTPVVVNFRWRPQLPDPQDEHVLEAALNGRADALITFNLRDFERARLRFGLEVATPGAILRRLETTNG